MRAVTAAVTSLLIAAVVFAGAVTTMAVARPEWLPPEVRDLVVRDRAPDLTGYQPPQNPEDYHHRVFEWTYAGKQWAIVVDIPKASYDYFQQLPRPERITQGPDGRYWEYAYEKFVTREEDDQSVEVIASTLLEMGRREGWTDDRILSFTLAFVQGLPYTSDSVTTGYNEYPRYPLETLVDNGGDCEDTSILYASLVIAMGYGAVLVSPPAHMAVGVLAKDDVPGDGYHYGGRWYLYAETTGDGFGIGEIPKEYAGLSAQVYELV